MLKSVRLAVACLIALTFFAEAKETKIRVALFDDTGSAGKGVPRVVEILAKTGNIEVTRLRGTNIASGALTNFDVVMFTGGSGSKQSKTLGQAGRHEVRRFVEHGGGYVGICAGAYLACTGFDWGIGVLNARTVSDKWQRGKGSVEIEIPAENKLLTNSIGKHRVLYANGPIITADDRKNIPAFEPLAFFRTELAENGTPKGVMVNAPAMARGFFGKGRVVISSPHPEQTPGLDNFVEAFVRWTAGKE
jgi:glutamine amidotransferase-like uncharacterized protein